MTIADPKTIEVNSGKSSIVIILEGVDKGCLFSKSMEDGKLVVKKGKNISGSELTRYFALDEKAIKEYQDKYFL